MVLFGDPILDPYFDPLLDPPEPILDPSGDIWDLLGGWVCIMSIRDIWVKTGPNR